MFGRNNDTQAQIDKQFFSIFDSKSNYYRDPIQANDEHDAIRAYETLCRTAPDDHLVANSEDFQLFKIGEYTRKSGHINSHPPKHIANLHEIKAIFMAKSRQTGIVPT